MLKVRIPPYKTPRNLWRQAIHAEVKKVMDAKGIRYNKDEKLSIEVKFYIDQLGLDFHDVDNRLKDVMDALQGIVGGNGPGKGLLSPLIDDDVQIYRATIEKMLPPGQSHDLGHVIVRKMGYGRK